MCTLIVALGVWPELPLVVAANRDESLTRPTAEPRLWPAGEVAARRVLAPRDLLAGGTWLGLNDAGLFVGITNRRSLVVDESRRSRGELVFAALGAEDHQAARARILERDPRDYNPFHLLFADRSGAAVVWGDGERFHELALGPGVHWLTERSFGAAESQRHALLAKLAQRLPAGPPPTVEGWRSILADHRPYQPPGERPPPGSVGLDALCVHAEPLDYGTRSSTLVMLGREHGEVRFLHASGRPCEAAFVEYDEAARALSAG
jgi:uncharacterized protein with NRDE domain